MLAFHLCFLGYLLWYLKSVVLLSFPSEREYDHGLQRARLRPHRISRNLPAARRRLLSHGLAVRIYPVAGHTDKTVGYETLQSMECLILLSKASDHVVYPTVLAVERRMALMAWSSARVLLARC